MEGVRKSLGYVHGIDKGADGSRGLCLGWKQGTDVSLRSYSYDYIDVAITNIDNGKRWRFTDFYGNPVVNQRRVSWERMRCLARQCDTPSVVMRDFNEICWASEKKRGGRRSRGRMARFRHMFEDCIISNLDYIGSWFTWERGRFAHTNIRERLDMGVGTPSWREWFPNALIRHLPFGKSDHCPLLVDTRVNYSNSGMGTRKLKFEAHWILETDCRERVTQLWRSIDGDVLEKLEKLLVGLKVGL